MEVFLEFIGDLPSGVTVVAIVPLIIALGRWGLGRNVRRRQLGNENDDEIARLRTHYLETIGKTSPGLLPENEDDITCEWMSRQYKSGKADSLKVGAYPVYRSFRDVAAREGERVRIWWIQRLSILSIVLAVILGVALIGRGQS